jgi:S-DNA-T family DNA segregation ATPase FtsK/SpoIIIE
LVLVLCAAVVLTWMSMLTYAPADAQAAWQFPPPAAENAAGKVGAAIAHTLRYWLGAGAYMGLILATVAACILVCGGRIGDVPWRLAGVILLIAATSTALYLRNPGGVTAVTNGSAGVLGHAIGELLLSRLQSMGAWLIVLCALAIGLMFTVDKLVLSLPRAARKAGGKIVDLAQKDVLPRWRSVAKPSGPPSPPRVRPTPAKTPVARREPVAEADGPATMPVAAATAAVIQAARKTLTPTPKPTGKTPAPQKKAPIKTPPTGATSDQSLPSADVLVESETGYIQAQEALAAQKRLVLQQTLNDFNVDADVVGFETGPVITMFEVSLAPGVKVAQVSSLATDIARALAVSGVRVVPHLTGRDTIGIEVPNDEKELVRLRDLMGMTPEATDKLHLPLYLGKDAAGGPIVADLAAMPHMLIAGTTGSGKSVCINTIVMSLLLTRKPADVGLILADPKMVEMAAFENIPHLLCPIVNDMRRAEGILEWAAGKMDERYDLLKEAGVRNIAGYNRLSPDELHDRMGIEDNDEKARVPTQMQYYIIIIDELADLIMTSSKEVETFIIRIAQKARAVGIHLILATQRPSANVVTGLIKSNMPCRISFQVASGQESRIVLDQKGAEVLLGQGDMLLLLPGTSNLVRAQGTYVDDGEIQRVVKQLRPAVGPSYNSELVQLNSKPISEMADDGAKDDMFDQAVEIVLAAQRGSVSLLQRRLQIGYGRASRIIDQMAEAGLLGEYKGSQARECMMTLEDWQMLRSTIAADQSGESSLNGEPTSA